MKNRWILLVITLLMVGSVGAQTQTTETILFAQGLFSISEKSEMEALETELREHPNVKIVRLDWETQRLFLLTKELNTLSEEELISWFGEYAETVHCIQIGVYNVDPIEKYPFMNCQNE